MTVVFLPLPDRIFAILDRQEVNRRERSLPAAGDRSEFFSSSAGRIMTFFDRLLSDFHLVAGYYIRACMGLIPGTRREYTLELLSVPVPYFVSVLQAGPETARLSSPVRGTLVTNSESFWQFVSLLPRRNTTAFGARFGQSPLLKYTKKKNTSLSVTH